MHQRAIITGFHKLHGFPVRHCDIGFKLGIDWRDCRSVVAEFERVKNGFMVDPETVRVEVTLSG